MEFLESFISPRVLWAVFAIAVFVFVVVSWVLVYHWSSYSKGDKIVKRASRVYFTLSSLILIGAALIILSL